MDALLLKPKATEECAGALVRGLSCRRYTTTTQLVKGISHYCPKHSRRRPSRRGRPDRSLYVRPPKLAENDYPD